MFQLRQGQNGWAVRLDESLIQFWNGELFQRYFGAVNSVEITIVKNDELAILGSPHVYFNGMSTHCGTVIDRL